MKGDHALRWYPAAWRDRYGDELSVHLADRYGPQGPPRRVRWSLVAGGVRERARGSGLTGDSAPPEVRVRAGVLTVLCAFGGFVVAGASLAKFGEHFDEVLPHGAGAHRLADAAFTSLQALGVVAGVLVVLGAVLAGPSALRFLRAGGWSAVRAHVTGAVAVLAGGLTAILAVRGRRTGSGLRPGFHWQGVVFLGWGLLVVVAIAAWTAVVVAVARRIDLSWRLLGLEAGLAVAVGGTMVLMLAATGTWWAALGERAPATA